VTAASPAGWLDGGGEVNAEIVAAGKGPLSGHSSWFTVCEPSGMSRETQDGRHVNVVTISRRRSVSALATTLALANADYSWRSKALCRDTDPELFFPVGTTGQALVQIEAAKAVCRQCEARAACLEFALATNQDSGIWGGTSEEERRKIRREQVARQRASRAV
jgi:WhiB family redox-sensing transcriptional regulator